MKPYSKVIHGHMEIQPQGYIYTNMMLTHHRLSVSGGGPGNHRDPVAFRFDKAINTALPSVAGWVDGNGNTTVYKGILGNGVPDNLATWHDSELTDAYNKALSKLTENVRGSLDLSVDAFQIRQTAAIAFNCKRAIKLARKIGSDRYLSGFVERNGFIKGLSKGYLLWTYGIAPIIQDIYEVVHHTANHYLNHRQTFKARHKNKVTVVGEVLDGWPDYTFSARWNAACSYRCQISVNMEIPDDPLTNVTRLTTLNPVAVAWELVPYSFVVDWFYNIGSYVRDLETALMYNSYFSGGYVSYSYKEEAHITASRKAQYLPSYGTISAQGQWTGLNRVILESYPIPQLPVLKANLGSRRLLNAAALLGNLLGRWR